MKSPADFRSVFTRFEAVGTRLMLACLTSLKIGTANLGGYL